MISAEIFDLIDFYELNGYKSLKKELKNTTSFLDHYSFDMFNKIKILSKSDFSEYITNIKQKISYNK